MTDILKMTPWMLLFEQAEDGSCMPSINEAVETVIELGTFRTWIWKTDNSWEMIADKITIPMGSQYPSQNDANPSQNGCDGTIFQTEREANPDYTCRFNHSEDGYGLYKPDYSWWFHGYDVQYNTSNLKGVLVQQYARLRIQNSIDDRHLAKYLFMMAADKWNINGSHGGEIGMGKRRLVTNDWQSYNFLALGANATSITKQNFIDSNPPFSLIP